MIVNYFLDRFSLMRTWKRSARLGAEMSQFSRKYFFSVSNIVMAVFTAFYFSAFPYDNLCDTGETVGIYDPSYAGNFTLSPQTKIPWVTKALGNEDLFKENLKVNVTIDTNFPVYSYCKQDFLSPDFFFTFPFLPQHQEKGGGEWMTPTQEQIATVLGWTSLAVVLAVILRIGYNAVQEYLETNYGTYKVSTYVRNQTLRQPDAVSSNTKNQSVLPTIFSLLAMTKRSRTATFQTLAPTFLRLEAYIFRTLYLSATLTRLTTRI